METRLKHVLLILGAKRRPYQIALSSSLLLHMAYITEAAAVYYERGAADLVFHLAIQIVPAGQLFGARAEAARKRQIRAIRENIVGIYLARSKVDLQYAGTFSSLSCEQVRTLLDMRVMHVHADPYDRLRSRAIGLMPGMGFTSDS